MQQVPLSFDEGFLFAVLPQGRFLLDTGSPASFGTTGQVTFGVRTVGLAASLLGIGMEHVRVLVHGRCEGLIGMDLLGAERLLLDVPGSALIIGDRSWDGAPEDRRRAVDVSSVMGGTPIVSASVGGRRVQAIFDTGARYCYSLDPLLVSGGEPQPDLDDFNPILGHLRSPSWLVDVDLHGGGDTAVRWRDRMAVMPPAQAGLFGQMGQMLGVSALVGNAWMRNVRLGMDMRHRDRATMWVQSEDGGAGSGSAP